MSLKTLKSRASSGHLQVPQKVEFYLIMLIKSGQGSHIVDFKEWSIKQGDVIFVQPGQVQQWALTSPFEAEMILINPSALPLQFSTALHENRLLDFTRWQVVMDLDSTALRQVILSMAQLDEDFKQFDNSAHHIAILRHQLMVLLLRLATYQQQSTPQQIHHKSLQTHQLFRTALETHFREQHHLQFYAKHLGYAQSTLSRACIAVEGESAKSVITERILLEAKRMLVHSDTSIAELSFRLGFSEPTNFVKFFRRLTNMTPNAFRQSMQPPAT